MATDYSTSGASLYIPAVGTALGVIGSVADIKAQGKATVANIKSEGKSLLYRTRIHAQQLEDLTRMASDKMSANGLEALKAEARLKAAGAETGTVTKAELTNTAKVDELHANAVVLRTEDIQRHSTKQQMVADRMSFVNKTDSMISGMPSGLSAGLSTFNASLSGFNSGMNYLNESQQQDFWGIDGTTSNSYSQLF